MERIIANTCITVYYITTRRIHGSMFYRTEVIADGHFTLQE